MKKNQEGTLKDQVYKRVIEEICAGNLNPNNIFTEGQMIEMFGVSKAPVREALVQLCHENVLRSIPRCGYQVIQISAKGIHDLTELRLYLELGSLPSILENMDETTLHLFQEMNRKRRINPEDRDIWTAWNNNVEYHLKLNEVARNQKVTEALERALSACTRAYAQEYRDFKQLVAPSSGDHVHDQLIDALERKDLQSAEAFLKRDIVAMEKILLDFPGNHS